MASQKETRQAWTDFLIKKVAAAKRKVIEVIDPTNERDRALWTMTEAAWQDQVIQVATLCGWQTYHTHDSRNSTEGFPDLVLLRPPRLIVAELKKMGEQPTTAQWEWLDWFNKCGAETFVWLPDNFDHVSRVLR